MSDNPAVQLNHFGQVYDAIGKLDLAADYFLQAMELDPACIIYQSHLAKVYVRQNRKDLETENLLLQITEQDDRPGWREWANRKLPEVLGKTRDDKTLINAGLPLKITLVVRC